MGMPVLAGSPVAQALHAVWPAKSWNDLAGHKTQLSPAAIMPSEYVPATHGMHWAYVSVSSSSNWTSTGYCTTTVWEQDSLLGYTPAGRRVGGNTCTSPQKAWTMAGKNRVNALWPAGNVCTRVRPA
jgi:hypothetical protein